MPAATPTSTRAFARTAEQGQPGAVLLEAHKGTLGANYRTGAWSYNLDGSFQTSQYADNANTESESADGSTGRIAGWMVWSAAPTTSARN